MLSIPLGTGRQAHRADNPRWCDPRNTKMSSTESELIDGLAASSTVVPAFPAEDCQALLDRDLVGADLAGANHTRSVPELGGGRYPHLSGPCGELGHEW